MVRKLETNIHAFNADSLENDGYRYTTHASLSSKLANQRITEAALAVADFYGTRVLDIGCGDGTYTVELFQRSYPASIHGIDPAKNAIEIAQKKINGQPISFSVESAYSLPFATNSFDIAHLRGVLHHMDHPIDALQEALRVARTLVVVEPNGYNPMLKVIERISTYHLQHGEKSYAPSKLEMWVNNLDANISKRIWAGLVPFFCPDWFARIAKFLEPVIEGIPLGNKIACAIFVFSASKNS